MAEANGGRPPMDPEERYVGRSISGPPSFWQAVEDEATKRGVTVSEFVRGILQRHLRRAAE